MPEATKQQVLASYGKLPMGFEANQGQTDSQVKFLARGSGYTLFLTASETVLSLRQPQPAPEKGLLARKRAATANVASGVVRLALVGANPAPLILGRGQLPGRSNYFIGNHPEEWRTNIPSYAKVQYRNVYPGVDLVYYGNQRQLEHDFVVAPGAHPETIALGIRGARDIQLDARGDLVLRLQGGEVRLEQPRVYQEQKGRKRLIPARYVLRGEREVGFEVAAYDTTKPLVIDPILSYSTYLGGSGDDQGFGIAVDSSGNAYVTGKANSTNFPGPTSPAFAGGAFDAFVAKLNAAGSAVSYSTYLGGNDDDEGFGIAVDSSGNAYVAGLTASTNFPTTPAGVVQPTFGGGLHDAFVAKLSSSGAVSYATYLGGSGDDQGFAIAVDSSLNAYVVGVTNSTGFATPGAMQITFGGGTFDAFLAKLNPTGTSKVYATYIGGSALDEAFGVAVDSSGNAYVAGLTSSTDFKPTPTGAQTLYGGGFADAFVVKVKADGTAALYSTYLGGSGDDEGFAIALDSSANAYVAGLAGSSNFPKTPGAFQTTFAGAFDAFAAKLDTTKAGAASLIYSTYLRGTAQNEAFGIAVDSSGNAYVTGFTTSTDFPVTPFAFQSTFGGGAGDVFITKLNATGSGLVYSTYFGKSGDDEGNGIAVDSSGNAYVAGFTDSNNLTTTTGAAQTAFGGGLHDAFVIKVVSAPLAVLSAISSFGSQAIGTTSAAKAVTLSNNGDALLSITSITTSGDFAQTNNCGSSLAAGANCSISVTFTPTAAGARNGTLTVNDNSGTGQQTLALSGTGSDFSISASPTSVSVTAGKSATYTITITPLNGFNQAVALSCSGAPSLATCSISPPSVTPNGVSAATATVTVTTTAMVPPQPQAPPPTSGLRRILPWLALLAAGAMLAGVEAARRRRVSWLLPTVATLVLLVCLGCAGRTGTPQGVSTLTITGTSGSLSHSTTINLVVF